MFTWRWLPAGVALVASLPAALVTALVNVHTGTALAVGMIPALAVGIPRARRRRSVILLAAVILGILIVLGATVAPWPQLALTTIFVVPILATWSAKRIGRPRLSMLLVLLAPPLVAIGFSLDGFHAGVSLAALFILGSVVTWPVALAVPPQWIAAPAAQGQMGPPRIPGVEYGVTLGFVGVITASIGYILHFDHIGWACAAALLVMRPDTKLQEWRTLGRFGSVVAGAAAAALMIQLGAPPWLLAVAVSLVLAAAAGTRGSRWYILPAFTTFLVILLLSFPDSAEAAGRFMERVGETLLGLAVAAIVGFGLPAVLRQITAYS